MKGLTQGEAAHDLATKLGVSPAKSNGFASEGKANGNNGVTRKSSSPSNAPKIFQWGDEGPPKQADELRRHVYRSRGYPLRIKVKLSDCRYVQWYRVVEANGAPVGWQNRKPADYGSVPYITRDIDPFDAELVADEIFWSEGEKDIDSLNNVDLPAFTFGGVGDGLPDDIARYLKGRKIVVLADNDEPGRAHAEKKAAAAHAAGALAIKILHFTELPAKGDVFDFIANGGTAEQLIERTDATAPWAPAVQTAGKTSQLVSLAAIKPEATDWLWWERIPRGAQTISTGWPGVGKSQQQCDMVARVSTGTSWPDGTPCPCGDTIMLTCEDSYAKTVIPRLLGAKANLQRVHALPIIRVDGDTKRAFLLTEDLGELERHLNALPNAVLVTIDPIPGFLGAGKINSNSVTDIRGTLAPLSELAERKNIAIHTVTHPSKATTSAMNAFIGSQAFVRGVPHGLSDHRGNG